MNDTPRIPLPIQVFSAEGATSQAGKWHIAGNSLYYTPAKLDNNF